MCEQEVVTKEDGTIKCPGEPECSSHGLCGPRGKCFCVDGYLGVSPPLLLLSRAHTLSLTTPLAHSLAHAFETNSHRGERALTKALPHAFMPSPLHPFTPSPLPLHSLTPSPSLLHPGGLRH